MKFVTTDRLAEWNDVWSLAVVFGAVSVPWTYAFVAGGIPLWPAFVASATFFATDRAGLAGLARGYASNAAGIVYAAATLAIVEGVAGDGLRGRRPAGRDARRRRLDAPRGDHRAPCRRGGRGTGRGVIQPTVPWVFRRKMRMRSAALAVVGAPLQPFVATLDIVRPCGV